MPAPNPDRTPASGQVAAGDESVPVNLQNMERAFASFHRTAPFDHCVVDDFIVPEWLAEIEREFLAYDAPKWFVYKNAIEDKKALNDWHAFPPATYRVFHYLNSAGFVERLSALAGTPLYSDDGLNGGGWHIHGPGGNLNPHLDYNIHPKLGLQRKINIIVYVSREMKEDYGGHLGLWDHDAETSQPGKLSKEIAPNFNRAVIFDTTQNSWHGMSRPLTQPAGIYRKSLAIYYMCDPPADANPRGRALFAPREDQKGDAKVEELIKLRSNVNTSSKVYS
jgi:Rps23 Pro-64 3,4-dihydroxylase Tpa1-like proline 4-hydroxylase